MFNEKFISESTSNYQPKNKVGFNLLLWTAAVSEKMTPLISELKKIGYDGVEIVAMELNSKPYVILGNRLRELGLEVTMVMVMGKEEDPIHESQIVRNKAIDKLKWTIDCANDVGAKIICGPFHSAFANFRKRAPIEDEYKWSAEVLHKAGDYAAESNITLALEAINRFECYLCNTSQQLNKLIKLTAHPNVKAMFDSHHANIEEKDLSKAIKELGNSLAHVHISENDRGTPGDGHIRWDDIFSTLSSVNYNGYLTIEAFSRQDVDFANSINVWREYSKPWDIAIDGLSFIKRMQEKHGL